MLENHDGRWSVGCSEHDAEDECIGYISLTTFARQADAIKAWNRRAVLSAPASPATASALRERVEKWLDHEAIQKALSPFEIQMIRDLAARPPSTPKFEKTSCSQCGREFGPGDHGYSHCDQHQPLETWIAELIRNEYDRAPDLGRAGYPAFEREWNDGAEEIARKIVERLGGDQGMALNDEELQREARSIAEAVMHCDETCDHGFSRAEIATLAAAYIALSSPAKGER
jgi:hypothetical protein